MSLLDVYAVDRTEADRNKNDFYPTAPVATRTLLRNYDVPKSIWEPASGRGWISRELVKNGHEVIATDLYEYEKPFVETNFGIDFLQAPRYNAEGLVTNPPFKQNLPEKLIRRALNPLDLDYGFVAIFARLTFMESSKRYSLFTDHPPTKILVFSERVNCDEKMFNEGRELGGMVAYAWYIWDKKSDTKNEIQWVRPSLYIGE